MMKKLCLLGFLLLIVTVKAFAQSGQVFHLNKLSKNDTLLSGWQFQAGDKPQWADPSFDDSHWKGIDPGQDIPDFSELKNQVLAGSGYRWIR